MLINISSGVGNSMNRLVASLALVTTSVAGLAGPLGSAQAVSIANGSFESGINPGPTFTGPLGAGATNVDNWTIESGSIDYIGGYWQAKDGTRSIDLNGTS